MNRFRPGAVAVALMVLSAGSGHGGQAGQPAVKSVAVPVYQPKFYPYERGEKALYRATWNGMFSIATAEVRAMPAVLDGKRVFQVRIEARTSSALDMIWKMRDTISSTFEAKALLPARFTFNQRENARVIDTEAFYDPSTQRWSVHRRQLGKQPKIYDFDSENTLDPITTAYTARSLDFKVGDRLYFKVFGGRYRYLVEMWVEKREAVTLGSGKTVEAFRITPRVQNLTRRGYAPRLNEATVWLTADDRRLPVKLSSKIVFGTVFVELADDPRPGEAAASDQARPAS